MSSPRKKAKVRGGTASSEPSALAAAPARPSALLVATEAFVRQEMAGQDGSHDWLHLDRVRNLALSIAKEEGLPASSLPLVELCALLHDVQDWKYSGSDTAGEHAARTFLTEQHADTQTVDMVCYVIQHIGFKSELASLQPAAGKTTTPQSTVTTLPAGVDHEAMELKSRLLAVVQDADRLDAQGAVGIARCFTYGGFKRRALYDPDIPFIPNMTQAQYKANNGPSINHFHEKLLKLKDLMKTKSGQRRALLRHDFMLLFLARFEAECQGE